MQLWCKRDNTDCVYNKSLAAGIMLIYQILRGISSSQVFVQSFRRHCTNISLRKYIHYSDISDTLKRKRNNYIKNAQNNQKTAINAVILSLFLQ